MTDTLAQMITKLQALLLGDSDTFSTATCTAAIRQALKDMNLAAPCHAAETQEAVTDQYEYELTDQSALEVVDVLLRGSDTYTDKNTSLAFDGYFEDDRPFFRLRVAQADGDTLIVRYTKPYGINGLDSETDTTLPGFHVPILLDGAAWRACQVRAAGTIETINMNTQVSEHFAAMARTFQLAFESGLDRLGQRQFPTSGPGDFHWSVAGWEYPPIR